MHGRQQSTGERNPLVFGACARAQQGDEETRRGDAGGGDEGRETAAIGEVQLREGAVVEQVVHFGQGDGVFGW